MQISYNRDGIRLSERDIPHSLLCVENLLCVLAQLEDVLGVQEMAIFKRFEKIDYATRGEGPSQVSTCVLTLHHKTFRVVDGCRFYLCGRGGRGEMTRSHHDTAWVPVDSPYRLRIET